MCLLDTLGIRRAAVMGGLTHEGLAAMLGVRRVGITVAAGSLQRRGIVRYCRGVIEVLDRAGLEAAACGCYAAERAAYQRVLG